MIGLVIRDYRLGWKQGLKNITKNNSWFWYLYFLIFPVITIDYEHSIKGMCVYYGILIPVVLGMFLSRMYPCRLSKTMFLCPMEKIERERYIFSAYWLRVLVSFFLFTGIGFLLIVAHLLSIWQFLLLWVSEFLFSLSTNLYLDVAYQKPKFEKKYNLKGYTAWHILIQIFGFIFFMICLNFTIENQISIKTWKIVILVLFLIVQIAITAKMIFGYSKKVMEIALDYELCFGILDNSEGK